MRLLRKWLDARHVERLLFGSEFEDTTGSSRSTAAAPRSTSKGRYAVYSGQSTCGDHRRHLVPPGLGPSKALVGHERPLAKGSFGAAQRSGILTAIMNSFIWVGVLTLSLLTMCQATQATLSENGASASNACFCGDETLERSKSEPSHPIPSLHTLDVYGVKKTGGADLAIVVASPLQADEHSRHRLLAKIRNYVDFISSPEFGSEAGAPTSDNTSIVVHMHPASDSAIFDLIDRCKPWVLENNASLRVELLPVEGRPTSSN